MIRVALHALAWILAAPFMITGAVPLEELQLEHRLEYDRLKASGELEKYLVEPPSEGFETGVRVLAAVLILPGPGLLTLVMIGYATQPHQALEMSIRTIPWPTERCVPAAPEADRRPMPLPG
ncbi:MAG: hypothetical protein WAM94_11010 [Chromatiaceae bacterium]